MKLILEALAGELDLNPAKSISGFAMNSLEAQI